MLDFFKLAFVPLIIIMCCGCTRTPIVGSSIASDTLKCIETATVSSAPNSLLSIAEVKQVHFVEEQSITSNSKPISVRKEAKVYKLKKITKNKLYTPKSEKVKTNKKLNHAHSVLKIVLLVLLGSILLLVIIGIIYQVILFMQGY